MAKSKSAPNSAPKSAPKAPAKTANKVAAPAAPAKEEKPAFANSETRATVGDKTDEPAHVGGGNARPPLAYPVQ